MPRLSAISRSDVALIATATLTVETHGESFVDITQDATAFVRAAGGGEGILLAYIRHTSASLLIQENADPDVQTDLRTALRALAPQDAAWVHDTEGLDDMPSHVMTMLTGVSIHVPVIKGALALGTWQGLYVAEHRAHPHRREVILSFVGSRPAAE
jgi:secondary thiamine-phosphate synthase enzyme